MIEPEPDITINGHTLNNGQAMTVRCAIESFAFSLADDEDSLWEDAEGLRSAYFARIKEIRKMIFKQ